MPVVLIVEDSELFASLIKDKIEHDLGFRVRWAQTFAQARALLEDEKLEFFFCLLDFALPDDSQGEILDLVLSKSIPSIVFTEEFNYSIRETVWSYHVADYVLKESSQVVDYIVYLIRRIYLNQYIKVLVVDDSRSSRQYISDLLKVHKYVVLEAKDGIEALKVIEDNPEIEMVIVDYSMPNMDGFELTKILRTKHPKEELAIIGLSAQWDILLSARFIKSGANDFIAKPFVTEEFYCRVTQNIEMIEKIKSIKESSSKDYLTDLYNRRYFFEFARKLYARQQRDHLQLTVAMLDIDFFKKVNDTYGHDAGDAVLRSVARILKNRFRESDLVSRFGGEEFCILTTDMQKKDVQRVFEDLRIAIEKKNFQIGDTLIKITASIGVCARPEKSLDEMIKEADSKLYEAKKSGRNRVIISE